MTTHRDMSAAALLRAMYEPHTRNTGYSIPTSMFLFFLMTGRFEIFCGDMMPGSMSPSLLARGDVLDRGTEWQARPDVR